MAVNFNLSQSTKRTAPGGRLGVPYAEDAQYGTVFQGGEAQESKRLLVCNWTDRYNLALAMLPLCNVSNAVLETPTISKFNILDVAHGGPGTSTANRYALNRLEPEVHPVYPHLYAAHAREVEGLGSPALDPNTGALSFSQTPAPSQTPNTGFAHVEITYKPFPFPISTAPAATNTFANELGGAGGNSGSYESFRYTTVKGKGSIKFQPTPPGGGAGLFEVFPRIDPANQAGNVCQPVNDPGSVPVPMVHLAYTWHMVPAIPTTAISMMGMVNSQVFDKVSRSSFNPGLGSTPWRYNNFPIGTVFYSHPDFGDEYYLIDGTPVVDITYNFIYTPVGWNTVLSMRGGGFVPVYRGSTRTITRDFRDIIAGGPGPIWVAGQGPAGPPPNNPGFGAGTVGPFNADTNLRFPPGYNIVDYVDLNLLFAIMF